MHSVVSFHPSVTLMYCFETTELIIKQLALDCSLGTLVHGHQHGTYVIFNTSDDRILRVKLERGIEKL